jgi:hypothetical protein
MFLRTKDSNIFSIGYLHVLIWKVSIQLICPFSNWYFPCRLGETTGFPESITCLLENLEAESMYEAEEI